MPGAEKRGGVEGTRDGIKLVTAMSSRRQMLIEFLRGKPGDTFARYALALDYAGAGEPEAALAEFKRIIENDSDYAAAYQQAGQLLVSVGRSDEARIYFERGIAAAQRKGNQHAASEMQGMLEELG